MQSRMSGLASIANAFARAMTAAFSRSARSGRQFESVLRSLAVRLSSMLLNQAFRSLFSGSFSGGSSGNLFDGFGSGSSLVDTNLLGGPDISMVARMGAIKPFAGGGVIGTPTYFPLAGGGLGLAGEAGPEAILPLARTSDGRLGVMSRGASGAGSIVIQIVTPDVENFRRSEAYVTGQIARAVARGQRSL
ncbi:MAG TPA: phage tail tape measure protein [Xanthobacteraceae bacterium]|nr:phage tail tape measure protein [Xanthobacteraceae bacterium]